MALLPKRLAQFVATTAEVTYYTVGAGKQAIVKNIIIANTSVSAVSLALSLVPSGGTAGNANRILPTTVIPASTQVKLDLTQVMNAGDFLSAIAGANTAITVTASGMEG